MASYLDSLPPNIRKLIEQQGAGFYGGPEQSSSAGTVMSNLQSAVSRRFGNSGDYDPIYDSGQRALMEQIPGLEAQYQKGLQRTNEDFSLDAQELDREKGLADSRHLNVMANNGMGFSGANLVGQGRIGETYQRGVQGLVRGRTRTLDDMTDNQNSAYQSITSKSGELQGEAASRASAKDEERAWQMEQVRMEQERAKHEQEMADAQLSRSEQIYQQNQQAIAEMRQQMIRMNQPRPSATGTYQRPNTPMSAAPTSVDRGGGSAFSGARTSGSSRTGTRRGIPRPNIRNPFDRALGRGAPR